MKITYLCGTNTGEMGKMKPTGKRVTASAAEFIQWESGKIRKLWRFIVGGAVRLRRAVLEFEPCTD